MTRLVHSSNDMPPDPLATPSRRILLYIWAVAAVSVAVVVRLVLTPMLGAELPFITLFPAIFIAAYLGGLGPAVSATVFSVLAALFLFARAGISIPLTNPTIQIGTILFATAGVGTGLLGEARLRALRRAAFAAGVAEAEAARAEEETVRAEEEAARAEEETLRAEEEAARAEREAERAAETAARVERILQSITDAFVVVDREWMVTYMNERAAVLLGRGTAECVGHNFWQAFPEVVGGPFEQTYRRTMTGQQPARVEGYYALTGTWLEVMVYPSSEGLSIVSHDVTSRVQAQETTARLAAIVASSDDAIVSKQLDGTIVSWNAAAERIFGYTAAEMIGDSIYRLIPPELHELEHEVLARIGRGERVEFWEGERVTKDGRRIIIAFTVSPIRDGSGRVVGASSIKRDITAQKRIQVALEAESTRSRDLAQALDAAQVFICDMDGRISYWSSGSARLLGWSAEEALGQMARELLRTEYPVPADEIRTILLARDRWEGELLHVAKDGRRIHVATQLVLRRDARGEPISAIEVNTDVTARRQAEERIRQAERMEVVGQLAGGVAHEANNQMTVVLGAADFLLRRTDLPDVARKDVEQVRAAAERTAAITAQLLAFSRRQVLQPQVLDLDEAVQGLEGVLSRAIGVRSTLWLRLGAAPARIRADPGQLAQVLLNLALNARDAMPLGGQLTIETGVTELTGRYADQHPGISIRPGPYTVVSVTDTGHGMSPETMRHIFEPFYTTKPVGKGTGLGLATVYGIVKQTGGYVWVYSELGRGTTFKVYLPIDAGVTAEPAVVPALARAAGETVLLVEDEAAVRATAARALREQGYHVIEAGRGEEALKLLEHHDGVVELMVTDVVMPGIDGPELARCAGRLRPGLPILFISGYTDDDVVRRGLLDAGQPFLQKPFTPEALLQRVADLLHPKPQS